MARYMNGQTDGRSIYGKSGVKIDSLTDRLREGWTDGPYKTVQTRQVDQTRLSLRPHQTYHIRQYKQDSLEHTDQSDRHQTDGRTYEQMDGQTDAGDRQLEADKK